MRRLAFVVTAFAAWLLGVAPRALAHEVPPSVTVLTFVRPEGDRLRLLVRAPLEAMRDVELPLRGAGYLDLARAGAAVGDAARLWVAGSVTLYEGDARLPDPRVVVARVSLPDASFGDYNSALSHLAAAPLALSTELPWKRAMLDVLLEYPIRADTSRFSVRPAFARLGMQTATVVRFLPPGGAERAFRYEGDPGLVRLDPRWHQAALHFVRLGFAHILDGLDHLLFVLCLVIPVRRARTLVAVVTAFTAAHSITLAASALGLAPSALWFPPLVETLIALSIVYMAFENIVGARLNRRWRLAFAFGLVHGFGFSFLLRDSLQFAGSHLALSLAAFNVGVELGQLAVLAVAVPALALLFRHVVAERLGTILLSALVAHSAWHWMTERGSALREYRWTWPAFDAAFAAGVLRALMLAVIVGGAMWVLYNVFGRAGRGSGVAGRVSS